MLRRMLRVCRRLLLEGLYIDLRKRRRLESGLISSIYIRLDVELFMSREWRAFLLGSTYILR